MSSVIPNDQFLLYGFSGVPTQLEDALRDVRQRARRCPELGLQIRDDHGLRYPVWEPREIGDDQFLVHDLGDPGFDDCLAAVAALADHQLDATRVTWRMHVFPRVRDIPTVTDMGTVIVVQVAHALADGGRSADLAGLMFGRPGEVRAVEVPRLVTARLPWRAAQAARWHRRLVRDEESDRVPRQADSRAALRSNAAPAGPVSLRTIVRSRDQLGGPTVTVAVLAAVSAALAEHLRELGDDPSDLGAEVPMAKAGPRMANNQFGNVGVGLYPMLDRDTRIGRIGQDLAQRRRRAQHPAMLAASRAYAATPAPLLRWGVTQFDSSQRSPTVTGNTVVSSVNRGPADLRFGATPVVMTAGYPALSPMMGLTHGVHGVGDTVALSVHAAESAVGDIDAYVARLERALTSR
ncbi:WS/DGAT domain-containing protein [Mycobacterium aquaticum]|nr:WS/DGAT domain-containing protein [Mycobacterium aquaticum]